MRDDEPLGGAPAALPVLPGAVRTAVSGELHDVEELVAGISIQQCGRPSAVRGWSILQAIAHLQLALALYTRLLDASVKGRAGGMVGRAFGTITERLMPVAAPALDAVNSALPRVVTGALAPEAVKGQFLGSARRLHRRLDALEPRDYTRPVHYRGGPWPLSFFLTAMLNELAIHRWDIASPLGPDAHLSEGARSFLPWFYWGGTSFLLRTPRDTSGSVSVMLRDPDAEFGWIFTPPGGKEARRGPLPEAGARVRGESGTFLLVLAGRIPVADALRATSLTVEGDEPLGRTLLGSWRLV